MKKEKPVKKESYKAKEHRLFTEFGIVGIIILVICLLYISYSIGFNNGQTSQLHRGGVPPTFQYNEQGYNIFVNQSLPECVTLNFSNAPCTAVFNSTSLNGTDFNIIVLPYNGTNNGNDGQVISQASALSQERNNTVFPPPAFPQGWNATIPNSSFNCVPTQNLTANQIAYENQWAILIETCTGTP